MPFPLLPWRGCAPCLLSREWCVHDRVGFSFPAAIYTYDDLAVVSLSLMRENTPPSASESAARRGGLVRRLSVCARGRERDGSIYIAIDSTPKLYFLLPLLIEL